MCLLVILILFLIVILFILNFILFLILMLILTLILIRFLILIHILILFRIFILILIVILILPFILFLLFILLPIAHSLSQRHSLFSTSNFLFIAVIQNGLYIKKKTVKYILHADVEIYRKPTLRNKLLIKLLYSHFLFIIFSKQFIAMQASPANPCQLISIEIVCLLNDSLHIWYESSSRITWRALTLQYVTQSTVIE